MPVPPNRAYAVATGHLATLLGISISSARRRVDLQAARDSVRDAAGRVVIAERLIEAARADALSQERLLDQLLVAKPSESNFLDED
jgi:hypothetical protein